MRKFNAHGATDVTGFGILGHAQALCSQQRNEVNFAIHNLPVIAKMHHIAKAVGTTFKLLQGYSPETSGKRLLNRYIMWVSVYILATCGVSAGLGELHKSDYPQCNLLLFLNIYFKFSFYC